MGALATLPCELGQVRKEAAAAGDVCAGMSLAGLPPNSAHIHLALSWTHPPAVPRLSFLYRKISGGFSAIVLY